MGGGLYLGTQSPSWECACIRRGDSQGKIPSNIFSPSPPSSISSAAARKLSIGDCAFLWTSNLPNPWVRLVKDSSFQKIKRENMRGRGEGSADGVENGKQKREFKFLFYSEFWQMALRFHELMRLRKKHNFQ
jgi:hypothetical protein